MKPHPRAIPEILVFAPSLIVLFFAPAISAEIPGPIPVPVDNHKPPQPKQGRYRKHLDQKLFHDRVARGQMNDAVEIAFDNLSPIGRRRSLIS